ncbi:MAG TPA: hypothetical protein VFS33_10820 [Gemmatimonadales bacterium]|nr:hypothetical protein [Gemmatimonadales bacterium]
MLTVTINGNQVDSDDEPAITQQVNGRREDSVPVCVKVRIEESGLEMILSTPECGSLGGGGRPLNPKEEYVVELWGKQGLNSRKFHGGQVIAFLKQLKKLLA